MTEFAEAVRRDGWAVRPHVVSAAECDRLADMLTTETQSRTQGGLRNLLETDAVVGLARSAAIRGLASEILGPGCFAVRGLFFDKRPEANWKVPWHQDLTIAVRERREVAGYGPWSVKAGEPHVHAPAGLLANMLAVRIHLDDCGFDNGPLRMLPGSHAVGVLPPPAVEEWVRANKAVVGVAGKGSVLAFRPLLLHASSPAESPSHRRVVHLEFANTKLDGELAWRWQV